MTRDELNALGVELMSADEADDSRRLAALAWQLYSAAGISLAEIEQLHSLLRCATPAAAAGPKAVPPPSAAA
jgi:hypothetical protein